MKLMIVVPCYNEEAVLPETTSQLIHVVGALKEKGSIGEGDILYVDDGSKDRTWELIESLSRQNAHVTGIKLAHNVGHQQALWPVWHGPPPMPMRLFPLTQTCRMMWKPSIRWWTISIKVSMWCLACARSGRPTRFSRRTQPWLSIA